MLCPASIPVGDCYVTLWVTDELKVFQIEKMFLQLGQKHLGKISRTNRQILEKIWQLCTPSPTPKKEKGKEVHRRRRLVIRFCLHGMESCRHWWSTSIVTKTQWGCFSENKAAFRGLLFPLENIVLWQWNLHVFYASLCLSVKVLYHMFVTRQDSGPDLF